MKLRRPIPLVAILATMGLAHANAQTATYDPATRILRVPSVQVGNVVYSDLVYRADSGAILSVGPGQPTRTPSNVSATCSAANITLARFNAITQGMTLDQVNSLIGCANDPMFTSRSAIATIYTWQTDYSLKSITVYFDPQGTVVTSPSPTVTLFKFSSGI